MDRKGMKPFQTGINFLHIKYGLEITVELYCISWEMGMCEMRFGRCRQFADGLYYICLTDYP